MKERERSGRRRRIRKRDSNTIRMYDLCLRCDVFFPLSSFSSLLSVSSPLTTSLFSQSSFPLYFLQSNGEK
jgi:hypothetical protein